MYSAMRAFLGRIISPQTLHTHVQCMVLFGFAPDLCFCIKAGRYTGGSFLPQHAPATRSPSKAPSSAPTISSEKICCATKPEFCSLISNWFDMREQAPGANLLHESVSGASSLVCTEICLCASFAPSYQTGLI